MSTVAGRAVRVVVADDHQIWRAGIRADLGESFAVVGEAEDAPGAIETARRERPDLVLCDLNMPGGGGMAVVQALAAELPVVVLTVSEFGSQRRFDGLLRFQLPIGADESGLMALLRQHTRFVALVTLREVAQGTAMEHAYQIRLGNPRQRSALVQALEAMPGVQDVSLLLQEPTVEL